MEKLTKGVIRGLRQKPITKNSIRSFLLLAGVPKKDPRLPRGVQSGFGLYFKLCEARASSIARSLTTLSRHELTEIEAEARLNLVYLVSKLAAERDVSFRTVVDLLEWYKEVDTEFNDEAFVSQVVPVILERLQAYSVPKRLECLRMFFGRLHPQGEWLRHLSGRLDELFSKSILLTIPSLHIVSVGQCRQATELDRQRLRDTRAFC